MEDKLIVLIASFYLYCLCGWIWESVILPLSRKQQPYNRGFLNGPWIPIYGFGAILVIVLFDIRQVNYPIYTLFINGGVVACLLEYVTSYVMEKLFHRRWWDYSHRPFNVNGRICLEGFVCFGLFSVVAIDYVQPFLTRVLNRFDENILLLIIIFLTVAFIVDVIVSVKVALAIDEKVELFKLQLEDKEMQLLKNFQETQKEVHQYFKRNAMLFQRHQIIVRNLRKQKADLNYSYRRLIRAFPELLKRKKDD